MFKSMDINSYQSYEEPRTASSNNTPIKSIQSWKSRKTAAQAEIITTLNDASQNRTASFEKMLTSYAPQKVTTSVQNKESFQLSDVIDVINPLHHLPIVGTAYRSMTKDKLHPISGIIGGAIYGGPIGAITGTANAISKVQTGKDIGEHALNIVRHEPTKSIKHISMFKEPTALTPDALKTYNDDVTTLTIATMPPRKI